MRWPACLLVAMVGCRNESAAPSLRQTVAPSAAPVPGRAARAAASGGKADLGQPAPVGGKWLSCYGSFAPRNDPRLDVERLAEACGPPNGMVKVTSFDGDVSADAGAAPEHRFSARAGECFRVFAVAGSTVEDLDVEVLDSRRGRVAFDEGDDRWPIVEPDRSFCAFDAGEQSIRVTASHGAGRYAIELWKLP